MSDSKRDGHFITWRTAVGTAARLGNMLCRPPPEEVTRGLPVESDGKPQKRNRKVRAVTCQSNMNTVIVGKFYHSSRAPTSTTTKSMICRTDGQIFGH